MIPNVNNGVLLDADAEKQPSYTYQMQYKTERVLGYCDSLTAMEQAIYKIVNTERYQTPIYSWNYGIELADLFGKPTSYCIPEIERRIIDALKQDDRIIDVYDFEFSVPVKNTILVTFQVDTTEGNLAIRKEVKV